MYLALLLQEVFLVATLSSFLPCYALVEQGRCNLLYPCWHAVWSLSSTGLFICRTPPLPTTHTYTHTESNMFYFLLPRWLENGEDGVSLGYAVSGLLLQSKLHSIQLQALFHITERVLPPSPCSSAMSQVGAVQYVEGLQSPWPQKGSFSVLNWGFGSGQYLL